MKGETEHLCEMQARQAPRTTSLVVDLVVFPHAAVEDVGGRDFCVGTFFELVHRASAIVTQWQRINDRATVLQLLISCRRSPGSTSWSTSHRQ